MSQILRIKNLFIHVPSIARIRILHSPLLHTPQVYLQNHTGEPTLITYRRSEWTTAIQDYKRLHSAVTTCQTALSSVPWMEESELPNPLVESEKPMR
jgi:hypothetical protein